MRVVFARGKQSTKPDLSAPLTINNCGYYRDISQDAEVCRAGGREDYQIIFVRRGRLTVDDRVYRDGSVYIFTPGERQHYTYKALPKNCYYWLHFSGSKADEFAARYGLGGFYDKGDDAAAMENLFLSATDAFTMNLRQKQLFAVGTLLSVVALLCSSTEKNSPFRRAEMQIADLSQPLNVKELAASFNISAEHFIRSFKAYIGLTPLGFRQKCRVERAKELLSGSDLSVDEVAKSCGCDDALYFSRLFKKYTGMSPTAYRDLF